MDDGLAHLTTFGSHAPVSSVPLLLDPSPGVGLPILPSAPASSAFAGAPYWSLRFTPPNVGSDLCCFCASVHFTTSRTSIRQSRSNPSRIQFTQILLLHLFEALTLLRSFLVYFHVGIWLSRYQVFWRGWHLTLDSFAIELNLGLPLY